MVNRGNLEINFFFKNSIDGDLRKSARLDLEYVWGSHTIRGGYDAQKFTTSQAGSVQSSGGPFLSPREQRVGEPVSEILTCNARSKIERRGADEPARV